MPAKHHEGVLPISSPFCSVAALEIILSVLWAAAGGEARLCRPDAETQTIPFYLFLYLGTATTAADETPVLGTPSYRAGLAKDSTPVVSVVSSVRS